MAIVDFVTARTALFDAATKLGAVVGGGATGVASLVATAAGMIRTLARLQAEVKPVAHSTTSVEIGPGSKSFEIGADTYLPEDGNFKIRSKADPANIIYGTFESLVDGTLTINVTSFGGDGTHDDWTITPIGERGAGGETGASGVSRATTVDCIYYGTANNSLLAGFATNTDDLTLVAGMRVLSVAKTSALFNGPWIVQPSGEAIRDPDFPDYNSIIGAEFIVGDGTRFKGTLWKCTSPKGGTLGTTGLTFRRQLADQTQVLAFRRPIVSVEPGLQLFPGFYYVDQYSGFSAQVAPTDGSAYFEKPETDSATNHYRYWWDQPAKDGGASNENSLKQDLNNAVLASRTNKRPEIGQATNGVLAGPYAVINAAAPNHFPEGKDPALPGVILHSNGAVVDIDPTTGANLRAAGFVRGVQGASGGSWYGKELKTRLLLSAVHYGFYRIRIWTPEANNFGTQQRVYFYDGATQLGWINLSLEKKISTTEAIYSGYGPISSAFAGATRIVLGATHSGSGIVVVTGAQFHIDTVPVPWVLRADFAAPFDPNFVMGPDLFFIADRKLSIFPRNLLRDPYNVTEILATFTSIRTDKQNLPYVVAGSDQLEIDPSRLGPAATLRVQVKRGASHDIYLRELNCHVAPATGLSGAFKALMIGDSLTNRGLPNTIKPKVDATGLAVTFVGTVETSITPDSFNEVDGYLSEARQGVSMASYCNRKTDESDYPRPFAPGGEADYKNGSITYKKNRNPALRLAVDGIDPAQDIFNGYILDFDFLVNRFSPPDPTPDIVLEGHGKNDGLEENTATALADVTACAPVLLRRIRAGFPSARIGMWYTSEPWSDDARSRWEENIGITAAKLKAVLDFDDPHAYFINLHAHLPPGGDWESTELSVDSSTGVARAIWADTVHYGYGGIRETAGEVLAAFKANVALP